MSANFTEDRAAEKAAFLQEAGWGAAQRAHLAGDASARSYERLQLGNISAVLMDSPPGPGDDTAEFLRIGAHLASLGLSPPKNLASQPERGLLLLEDLGDGLFTTLLDQDPSLEPELYAAAIDVLLALQSAEAPSGLPNLTAADWAEAAGFAPQFYAAAITGQTPDSAAYTALLTEALQGAEAPKVLILRDYHAGNLLWLPDRKGLARVGLLDFQQGQMGHPTYDLVSLLQDARRDVSPETEAAGIARFAAGKGLGPDEIAAQYAAVAAQRALRIIGIFARLCLVSGKAHYVALIPRVWAQLMRNLSHPALTHLRRECLAILPEPSPENLARITAKCATLSP